MGHARLMKSFLFYIIFHNAGKEKILYLDKIPIEDLQWDFGDNLI